MYDFHEWAKKASNIAGATQLRFNMNPFDVNIQAQLNFDREAAAEAYATEESFLRQKVQGHLVKGR